MTNCILCPRMCHVDRNSGAGFCGCLASIRAARAGLHFYEEPFLSGLCGSGAVFFSGCNLRCVYCQNSQISGGDYRSAGAAFGMETTTDRLSEIFLELQAQGAHNINLVTGTPYIPFIAEALSNVGADNSLKIPVIWNSGGYERVESLKMLEGLVDIWLPDFKTLSPELGQRYMNAPDYPEAAKKALEWMVNVSGPAKFEAYARECRPEAAYTLEDIEESGIMVHGVCVRHLVIPGQTEDSKRVLEYLHGTFGGDIWVSLMSQYTPMRTDFPQEELNRTVTAEEYEEVVNFAIDLGIENCMIQAEGVANESFIPAFDGTGVLG